MDYMITTEQLTKEYKNFTSVNNVSLHIRKGSIYGFLGPNGAGKSTTMKMLLGLTAPTKGSFTIDGKQFPADRIAILKEVGSFIESPSFYANLTGRENLDVIRRILGLPKSAVEDALDLVGLTEFGDRLAKKYSLGMKQRLGLAGALLGRPPILILDEATSALDVSVQQTIIELIVKLQKEKNITIGFICHDISLIQSCAHEVAVMYLGNVVEVLPAEDLAEHAVHPYTRALIGSIFDIGMDFSKPIEEIKGEAPSPLDVPAGCPFRGRCPKATEQCGAEKPKLQQIGADHEVACHLFDKEDK